MVRYGSDHDFFFRNYRHIRLDGYLANSDYPSSIEPRCYNTSSPQKAHWLSKPNRGKVCDSDCALKWINATGGYAPIGLGEVIPCPVGTFANDTGLFYEWQCASCPPGMFCDGKDVKPCPSGTTSDPGAKSDSGMDTYKTESQSFLHLSDD